MPPIGSLCKFGKPRFAKAGNYIELETGVWFSRPTADTLLTGTGRSEEAERLTVPRSCPEKSKVRGTRKNFILFKYAVPPTRNNGPLLLAEPAKKDDRQDCAHVVGDFLLQSYILLFLRMWSMGRSQESSAVSLLGMSETLQANLSIISCLAKTAELTSDLSDRMFRVARAAKITAN